MQELIVAIIVACAAVVVLKRYAPKVVKQQVALVGARARRDADVDWHALAARIERQAQAGASCADGCGTCGNCGANGNPSTAKQAIVTLESLKQTIRR